MEPDNSYQMSLKKIKEPPELQSAEQQTPGPGKSNALKFSICMYRLPTLAHSMAVGGKGLNSEFLLE